MQQNKQQNKLNNGEEDMLKQPIPLSEEKKQAQADRKKKMNQRLVVVAILEVFILMMMSFAWYYYQAHRKVLSEERDVMLPYYLYLVEANGTDNLQMTVGNLHPGETKQIVFGVSNKAPEGDSEASYKIGKDSKFNYELELAYTQNLPVEYKVYELTKVGSGTSSGSSNVSDGSTITVEWKNEKNETVSQSFAKKVLTKKGESTTISTSNNKEMYGDKVDSTINLGQYDIYDTTSGASFDLKTTVNADGTVDFDLDYYMIEINWKDGVSFSDYLKETDLVYVIVKAMQLEPKEAAKQASE